MQNEEQIMFKVVDSRAMRTKVEVGQRRDGKVELSRHQRQRLPLSSPAGSTAR